MKTSDENKYADVYKRQLVEFVDTNNDGKPDKNQPVNGLTWEQVKQQDAKDYNKYYFLHHFPYHLQQCSYKSVSYTHLICILNVKCIRERISEEMACRRL